MNRKHNHDIFAIAWMALAIVLFIAGADPAYVAVGIICSVVEINAS